MNKIRAEFICTAKHTLGGIPSGDTEISFTPVVQTGLRGSITLSASPDVASQFIKGQKYHVEFTAADGSEPDGPMILMSKPQPAAPVGPAPITSSFSKTVSAPVDQPVKPRGPAAVPVATADQPTAPRPPGAGAEVAPVAPSVSEIPAQPTAVPAPSDPVTADTSSGAQAPDTAGNPPADAGTPAKDEGGKHKASKVTAKKVATKAASTKKRR